MHRDAVLQLPLWDVGSEPREIVRAFCSDFFGDQRLLEIFDLLAQADRMIYVERNRMVHAERATDGEFVATVAKALQIAYDHLKSQTDPRYRARAARLLQEVASRFNTQVEPTISR